MWTTSRLLLCFLVCAWSVKATAAKLPEGTSCTVVKPMALFKGAKGKKRVAKLTKDEVFVLGGKKGKRFAVTLGDGRTGFVAGKVAHKICPKPPQKILSACVADADLPLFKKPKGKKRVGKVTKGTKLDIGKAFKYRKSVVLADGRKGFIPKKKLAALCVEIPMTENSTTAAPAQPATPATPATPAKPGEPAKPATPGAPATPAGGPVVPTVNQPTLTQPVVNVPAVSKPGLAPIVAPAVGGPSVPGAVVPVVTPPTAPVAEEAKPKDGKDSEKSAESKSEETKQEASEEKETPKQTDAPDESSASD